MVGDDLRGMTSVGERPHMADVLKNLELALRHHAAENSGDLTDWVGRCLS